MSDPPGPPQGYPRQASHYGPPQPYGQQPPPGPPPGPVPYGYPPPALAVPRNGLGLAALICGAIGCLFGLAAIGFVAAGPLAIVAIALGITGMSRAKEGVATNGGVAAIGMLLGILAAVLSISGANRVFNAVDDAREQVGDNQRRVACTEKATTADEIWACSK